ncbi:MAG: hypothetical protein FWD52_06970 [Candidatus Bathyarchaeota archaeon]|nr:hypothetical protein [Candidatus Termiticorpusculum sp.]
MKINIKIEKLILHGFTPQEQTTIQHMIIQEITNTLQKQKQQNLPKQNPNNQPQTYNINTLKIQTTTNPQKIAHTIAHTIKNNTPTNPNTLQP